MEIIMRSGDEIIEQGKEYEFNVTVSDQNCNFAARLTLNKKAITIRIMCESTDSRNFEFFYKKNMLTCKGINKTFLLHNLTLSKSISRSIDFHPQQIGYFEHEYHAEYLIFIPAAFISNDILITSILLQSETINSWIGNTKTQQDIITAYSNNTDFKELSSLSNQLSVTLTDDSCMYIDYDITTHYSISSFSSGLRFPPLLQFCFFSGLKTTDVKSKFDDIYSLMSFFIGYDFPLERISLHFDEHCIDKDGFLYFPEIKGKYVPPHINYSFFPLGTDLCFNSLCLPEIPTSAFESFFNLDDTRKGYFNKYLKYRRMLNTEEQFLGYFRILESLCFKSKSYVDQDLLDALIEKSRKYLQIKLKDNKGTNSFLRGISRYNNSKYNTEKCLQDFYIQIPKTITEKWNHSRSDISDICKLRNDITHANNYYIGDEELSSKTIFIKCLLVMRMSELLGIPVSTLCEVIHRIDGYSRLRKYDT